MVELKEYHNFYVITGGPGVGKTTLLKELQKRGYTVIPEIARDLIKEHQKVNGEALPWKNKNLYKNLMFEYSISSFRQTTKSMNKENPVFFDRGFLDAICYTELIQSEISEQMQFYAENWRYNKTVFILPPWQAIYETDNERKQDWDEVILTHEKMIGTYKKYGYQVIEVLKIDVEKRADFVLNNIDAYR